MTTNSSQSFSIKLIIGLLLLLTGALLSCDTAQDVNSTREAYYRLILADAPCLDGICPGKGGRETNSERLQRSRLVEAIYDNGGSPVNFTLINPDPEVMGDESIGGGVLQFRPDTHGRFEILDSIFIDLSGLTLGTAIDVLGEPEEYLLVTGCGMGYWIFGLALYPSKSIILRSDFQIRRAEQEHLDTDKEVVVAYTSPQRYEEYLIQVLNTGILDSVVFDLEPQVNADMLLSQIQPWPGLDGAPMPSINLCPR